MFVQLFTPLKRGEHEHRFSEGCSIMNKLKSTSDKQFIGFLLWLNIFELLVEQRVFKKDNHLYEQDLAQVVL